MQYYICFRIYGIPPKRNQIGYGITEITLETNTIDNMDITSTFIFDLKEYNSGKIQSKNILHITN
ncbi:hypothetical protein [Candidatus Nitrosocosmicus franklandus]|uniref:hypothetical protein n=1 Tax=Candidatus Nitrosocosmicus franklandianus TaxID=1798806 RepID=UPI00106D9D29|nr:hypothetical protein [Candidatus Nitrosocosmicus franklandus]